MPRVSADCALISEPLNPVPARAGTAPTSGPLRDAFGREFHYLRIAVAERCNLRCVYCQPDSGLRFKEGAELLSTPEILRVVAVAAGLGVTKVRLTGGEPLLRPDLVELVAGIAGTPGVQSVHLTTNGVAFASKAAALKQAGLRGVNISLDTLDPQRFAEIARRSGFERTLAAIDLAVELGFESVKVNAVAMRGLTEQELPAFAALARRLPITIRFIELMPFDSEQVWKTGRFMSAAHVVEALHAAVPGLREIRGSSTEHHSYGFDDSAGRMAVIPAYSRDICATCDRIRLTADGKVRHCLFSDAEIDLRALLRGPGSDAEVEAAIRGAMWGKPRDGWEAQRALPQADGSGRRSMTQIGG